MEELLEKLKSCESLSALDGFRPEIIKLVDTDATADFVVLQTAFIKAKNRLKRVPLRDRK